MHTEKVNILLNVPKAFRVTVIPEGESQFGPVFKTRVEDDGVDVTDSVRRLTVCSDMRRTYAEMELTREGFDGPFCTPAISL